MAEISFQVFTTPCAVCGGKVEIATEDTAILHGVPAGTCKACGAVHISAAFFDHFEREGDNRKSIYKLRAICIGRLGEGREHEANQYPS